MVLSDCWFERYHTKEAKALKQTAAYLTRKYIMSSDFYNYDQSQVPTPDFICKMYMQMVCNALWFKCAIMFTMVYS